MSLALAVVLWVVVVQRAQPVQRTFDVPVSYGLVPSALTVAKVAPEVVKVTLAGPRKAFGLGGVQDIKLVLDLSGVSRGQNRVLIESRDLTFPKELNLEDLDPRRVLISVQDKPPEANGTSKP